MKVESAMFHVYGDHGRAAVYFSRRGNAWDVDVTIGRKLTTIDNEKMKLNPCQTHAMEATVKALDQQSQTSKPTAPT